MDLSYQEHIPTDFDPRSRVWVYQSSRLFSISEAFELETILGDFVAGWKSHGAPVKGYASLFFGQFIVIMADETATTVGGCSTDSSVHVIKKIETQFGVNMFDRQMLAFVSKDRVQLLPIAQLQYAADNRFITPDTLYFNNLVSTKEQWLHQWLIPVAKSWLAPRLTLVS